MKVQMIVTAVVLGLSSLAYGAEIDTAAQLKAMETRLAAQESQIAQLKGDSWMTERRAEEVKALVREVLSDAETRASLLDSGLTAGYKDGFFLASADGNFLLNIGGQVQVRYMFNNADEEPDGVFGLDDNDQNVEGFVIRRAKVRLNGHVFDPKLTYALQMNADFSGGLEAEHNIGTSRDDNGGSFLLEDAWVAYDFADGWNVKAGQFKAPFLRDELVDSKHQLAVERAFITDLLTVDRTQGVQVSWVGDLGLPVRAAVMLHDGSYMANTDYTNDTSDFAIAARGEVLLAGSWAQFDDYTTWSSDEFGLMIGAAIDWESTEEGAGDAELYDLLKWTIDASVEVPNINGLNAFAAIVGQHIDSQSNSGTLVNADQLGFILQAGIFIVPDKWDVFGRYEYIDLDGSMVFNVDNDSAFQEPDDLTGDDDDKVSILTFGTNYYFRKHAAKATLDFMWVMDPVAVSDTGAGITEMDDLDEDDEQFVVRAQFQLLF